MGGQTGLLAVAVDRRSPISLSLRDATTYSPERGVDETERRDVLHVLDGESLDRFPRRAPPSAAALALLLPLRSYAIVSFFASGGRDIAQQMLLATS